MRSVKTGFGPFCRFQQECFLSSEKIQLYPRKNSSGQWIKTIHFKFPMYYNDSNEADCDVCFDMEGNFLPKRGTDETVVLLSKREPGPKQVRVEFSL